MTLYQLQLKQELNQPVLVMVLEGWIDAGFGAAAAAAALLGSIPNDVIATFDSDELIDHRARRPVMHIVDGMNTGLNWPDLLLRAGQDRTGQDVLLLIGPEPDMKWHAFCDDVAGLAGDLGVRMVVGLGAFPAPVPHTRPVRLASTATDAELVAKVGFVPGTLDVPSGVQGALERRFAEAQIPAITAYGHPIGHHLGPVGRPGRAGRHRGRHPGAPGCGHRHEPAHRRADRQQRRALGHGPPIGGPGRRRADRAPN